MRKSINIGGKDIEMLANGLTPVAYKRVFKKDFLAETQKEDMDMTVFQELAFIMAMQCEKTDKEMMTGLTEEDYWTWLGGFGSMDIINEVDKVFAIFKASEKTASVPKKKPH